MNGRDEIADVIGRLARRSAETAADAILEAGYRKRRIISTADELDALPGGSVILHRGLAYQSQKYVIDRNRADGGLTLWECPECGVGDRESVAVLPALLLYVPEVKP